MFCGKCGAKILDGDAFCRNCGSAVAEQQPMPPSPTTSRDAVPESPGVVPPVPSILADTSEPMPPQAPPVHHDPRNPGQPPLSSKPVSAPLLADMESMETETLLSMFQKQSDWPHEALDVARIVLEKRGCRNVIPGIGQAFEKPAAQANKRPGLVPAGVLLVINGLLSCLIAAATDTETAGNGKQAASQVSHYLFVIDMVLGVFILLSIQRNDDKYKWAREWAVFRAAATIIGGPLLLFYLTDYTSIVAPVVGSIGIVLLCAGLLVLLWNNCEPHSIVPWRTKAGLPAIIVGGCIQFITPAMSTTPDILTNDTRNTPSIPRTSINPTIFQSEDGRFSIVFPPGSPIPKKEESIKQTPAGLVKSIMYQIELSSVSYAISYLVLPLPIKGDDEIEQLFNNTLKATQSSLKATVLEQHGHIFNGQYPARRVYYWVGMQCQSLYSRAEYIVVGNRMYSIGVIADSRELLDCEIANNFINSFNLKQP